MRKSDVTSYDVVIPHFRKCAAFYNNFGMQTCRHAQHNNEFHVVPSSGGISSFENLRPKTGITVTCVTNQAEFPGDGRRNYVRVVPHSGCMASLFIGRKLWPKHGFHTIRTSDNRRTKATKKKIELYDPRAWSHEHLCKISKTRKNRARNWEMLLSGLDR